MNPTPTSPLSPVIVIGLFRTFEIFCFGFLGLYFATERLSLSVIMLGPWPGIASAVALTTGLFLMIIGAYRHERLLSGVYAISISIISTIIVSVFYCLCASILGIKVDVFSLGFALFIFSLWSFLAAVRLLFARLLLYWNKSGRLHKRIALVGGGASAEELIQELRAAGADFELIGVFDDRTDSRSPAEVSGLRKLGNVNMLIDYARAARVDMILFTLPVTAEGRILDMLKKLSVLPVDVRLAAHRQALTYRHRSYSFVGSVPTLALLDRPLSEWDNAAKWLFDKIVGLGALLLLSPIMIMVAVAIKLDSPGPVLFKQKRFGFNNNMISVYKFRSMHIAQTDVTAAKLVTKNDPRVTRVGRFIRKTSLDELPQLFNVVFQGNLSLVGPRPHAEHAKAANLLYHEAVDGYFARHKVKPGITGWAQIHGWRGETDTLDKIQGRVDYDIHYIENWSLWLDLYILTVTPFALLKTENAY